MTTDEAMEILGVKEGSGFEVILSAKNRLLRKAGSDKDKKTQVETAYDLLLMQSMQKRLQGQLSSQSVRFADVVPEPTTYQKAQKLLRKLPGGISFSQSGNSDAAALAAGFAALGAWAFIQGLSEPPYVAQRDVPGLQLALAAAIAVYLLREKKRVSLARAAGLSFAGLIFGALVGGAFQGWLRVDIVPIGGFQSPGILVSEFALVGLWTAATLLA
eukprot:jgi/Astpho2/4950/e_gw1.00070.66.1_t